MQTIEANTALIAYCGLYCAACGQYLKGKCPGCENNTKATWCKIRTCCAQNAYKTCADCTTYANVMDCSKYNNFMSKLFGVIFRSDRQACIKQIKEKGYTEFARYMSQNGWQTIKR